MATPRKKPAMLKVADVDRLQPMFKMKAAVDPETRKPVGVEPRRHPKVIANPRGKELAQMPSLPYDRAVDGDGNLICLVGGTNWDGIGAKNNAYRDKRLHELKKSGGFLWDVPPHEMSAEEWAKVRIERLKELRADKAVRDRQEIEDLSAEEIAQTKAQVRGDLDAAGKKRGARDTEQ